MSTFKDKIAGLFKRPIPMWILLPWLLLAAVPPTLYGSLNIPTGGNITDSNVISPSCVQTNSSGKYVYATCAPTPYPTPATPTPYPSPSASAPVTTAFDINGHLTLGLTNPGNCIAYTAGSISYSCASPTPAPTPSPAFTGCTTITGSYPYTINSSACAGLSLNNIFTGNNIFAASSGYGINVKATGSGGSLNTAMEFTNTDTAPSIPSVFAEMVGFASGENTIHPSTAAAAVEFGLAGATANDYGGYILLNTKQDGTGNLQETVVLDPQGHVYEPNDQFLDRFNTPGACTAGTTCGTETWTFTTPFKTTTGANALPVCSSALIMDESDSTQIWIVGIKSISSTSIVYNYAPALSVGAAHTLDFYAHCNTQTF